MSWHTPSPNPIPNYPQFLVIWKLWVLAPICRRRVGWFPLGLQLVLPIPNVFRMAWSKLLSQVLEGLVHILSSFLLASFGPVVGHYGTLGPVASCLHPLFIETGQQGTISVGQIAGHEDLVWSS